MAAEDSHPFAGLESLIDERGHESARKPDPEHNGQAPDLFFQVARRPTSFLRAMMSGRTASADETSREQA